ncbi:hypothetical protein E2C01_048266 [Portunus trituberculatus]|uniref:Uncharacterized protein n=1 Tax=Portunus trituberculatus TaxID=210409 RepID=A0A5B7GAD2_PORTR|nr:hypothetical protein [Portunus trituberculatus]
MIPYRSVQGATQPHGLVSRPEQHRSAVFKGCTKDSDCLSPDAPPKPPVRHVSAICYATRQHTRLKSSRTFPKRVSAAPTCSLHARPRIPTPPPCLTRP